MSIVHTFWCAILIILLSLVNTQFTEATSHQPYFLRLGIIPGAEDSYASAISKDGTTVIGTNTIITNYDEYAWQWEGFRWTQSRGMLSIKNLPDKSSMTMEDMSSDGNVIVGVDSNWLDGGSEGFYWTPAGGTVSLSTLTGIDLSFSYGVTPDGQFITGYSKSLNNDHWIAFVWSKETGVQSILPLLGYSDIRGWRISNDGLTVTGDTWVGDRENSRMFVWSKTDESVQLIEPLGGGNYTSPGWPDPISANGTVLIGSGNSTTSKQEPFIWTRDEGTRTIGRLAGYKTGSPRRISEDGTVVIGNNWTGEGYFDPNNRNQGFWWRTDVGLVGLGFLPGHDESFANDMSGDGFLLVGSSSLAGEDYDNYLRGKAIIWNRIDGIRSLEDIASELGVNITGWQLYDVAGISTDGKTIAGRGLNPQGKTEGWILHVGDWANKPGIRVLSPKAGAKIKGGGEHIIRWASRSIDTVTIEYSTDGGSNWGTISGAENVLAANEAFTWTVPVENNTQVLIRVKDATINSTLSDTTDGTFSIYYPTIELLSPAGSESWRIGTDKAITFQAGHMNTARIEYKLQGGIDWTEITTLPVSAGGPTNTNWTIPDIAEGLYDIRVIDIDTPEVFDLTDSPVELFKPSIVLTSFDSGGRFRAGTIHTITWTSSHVGTIDIHYSDNGGPWIPIASNLPAETGTYSWLIPDTISLNMKIRVTGDGSAAINDFSAAPFEVFKPFVRIDSPIGGERWRVESSQIIKWTAEDIATVSIEFSTNAGIDWSPLVSDIDATLGSYMWTVPGDPSTDLRVRIFKSDSHAVSDESTGNFVLFQPTLSLTSPVGGERWRAGGTRIIHWESQDVKALDLFFSDDNGLTWTPIISDHPAPLGKYEWTLPTLPSKDSYRVRIKESGADLFSESPASFRVVNPVMLITSPTGGEVLEHGQILEVSWISTEIDLVNIEVSGNGGSSWKEIATALPSDGGPVSWTAGGVPTSAYVIRVSDAENPEVSDISNPFTVNPGPFFTGLGDLPGGLFESMAYGLSGDGQTVTGYGTGEFDVIEAFAWTIPDGMIGLGGLGGQVLGSEGRAASADGSVLAGKSFRGNFGDTVHEAAQWSFPSLAIEGLGFLDETDIHSRAYGISADGNIVVGSSESGADREAVLWNHLTGERIGLGDIYGGNFDSTALAVSDDGSTVVGQGEGPGGSQAFMWTIERGLAGLGDLPEGSHHSESYDVSADGSVIVGFGTSSFGEEAFRWTAAGGMVGLGVLDGQTGSRAYAVSDDGSLVAGTSGNLAFIWDAVGGMRDLNVVLASEVGLDLTGWTLVEARALSADGRTISGWGINPDGNTEAWTAYVAGVPSEPVIQITSPNGGQERSIGEVMTITWISDNVEAVRVHYSPDNGQNWLPASPTTIAAKKGFYNWTLPGDRASVSKEYRVRISDAGASQAEDISDGVFEVFDYYISLISPNGGEGLQIGDQMSITWESGHVENIRIEYSRDSGQSWSPLARSVPAAAGTYDWTILFAPGDKFRLRLTDTDAPHVSDASDSDFSLSIPPGSNPFFIGLGDLDGGSFNSTAYGVSLDGTTVVGSGYSASGQEAFKWTSAGGMAGLGDLAGSSFNSRAYAVSGDGQVAVGYSLSTAHPSSTGEAFRKIGDSAMVGLGTIDTTYNSSQAYSVSNDGTVVVGQTPQMAFVWNNGQMQRLDGLLGGMDSAAARDVSADGSIIVGNSNSVNGTEATLWKSGEPVGLGDLEGASFSSAIPLRR